MKSLITEPLGLYGWQKVEPVLLAALLSQEPLLLVGAHGCAKSFVLERLAESLGLSFRAYNASLLNYDDLVGVPLPDATRTKLEYLASPESIWEAEVVFIDEISRTRPELQNKLFPIIYERRVQGRRLDRLVYRWAAMNPPPTEEDFAQDEALYLGSEPLDAALADRFPFILPVPDWDDLSVSDQTHLLTDQFAGRHEFPLAIPALIQEARQRYEELIPRLTESLSAYVLALVPKLRAAHYDVSPRRATMLLRAVMAVHAARLALSAHTDDEAPTLCDSALLALHNTLPDRARHPLNAAELTAIFRTAWELSVRNEDDPLARLLRIDDPILRLRRLVVEHLTLPPDRTAVLIGEGVAHAPPHLRRGLALATYLALRERTDIPASTIELLAHEIQSVIASCKSMTEHVVPATARLGSLVGALVAQMNEHHGADSEFAQYHANLLNSLLPDGFPDTAAVYEASESFEKIWKEFGL